ncbi:MAG: bifunctional protein HldE [Pseudomonadota bacterium]|jgi:D-beta-D-heptose 7-phosphate kinase/D-beta-D-heptose 1-phosphate adenosyltransferase
MKLSAQTRADMRPVVVVGDVMLDRYWRGQTGRISPEAPVPIVRVTGCDERVGGAANVAANAAALGADVTLIGVAGTDADADRLEALCREHGLHPCLLRDPRMPTTVKLRVMAQHQQLLRLDFEAAPEDLSGAPPALEATLAAMLERPSVVVFSDYAKGALRDVQTLISSTRAAGHLAIVDPKGRDFSRYAGADLITPNLAEFEAVVGRCAADDDIVRRARELCAGLQLGAVLVTRGEHGMSLIPAAGEPLHLETRAKDVFDVTGAGDTVCAALAWALASGEALERAVELANTAAGLAVAKLGTAVVSAREIEESMGLRSHAESAILDKQTLHAAIRDARRKGLRIVMTNGCFDILHVGHVRYLEEAAALGDRLLVAVNSDASVKRLKGASRPLNSLQDRMEVLQRLSAVDWVIPFDTDTPRALIAEVLPDVLVKGGDYRVEEIAGAEEVLAAGGRVLTLTFHEGHSTTSLIERGSKTGETDT